MRKIEAKRTLFIPQIGKIKAKRSLFIQELKKIEAKRTRLIPEIGKIEVKKNKLDRSKTNRGGIPWLHNMKNEDKDDFFCEAKKNEYIRTSTFEGTKETNYQRDEEFICS